MNRRDLLKSLPVAAVPALIPAVSIAVETEADSIDRLARKLSAALTRTYGGQFKAVIGPDEDISYVWATPTPERRTRQAVSELRSAMADPGHETWLSMIREQSDGTGGGAATALLFDHKGSVRGQIDLGGLK